MELHTSLFLYGEKSPKTLDLLLCTLAFVVGSLSAASSPIEINTENN